MKRFSCPEEIDFTAGSCVNTTTSNLPYFEELIKGFKNPYIGNKRNLIIDIINTISKNNIQYNSVLDLFCGSACVSMMMKLLGKRVIANDILYSSSVYAEAFVKNNDVNISQEESEFIIKNNEEHDDFVLENFSNRFTTTEANNLDRIYANILKIFPGRNEIESTKRALAFANLQLFIMDRCFIGGRLNNGQVLAQLGHRIEHKRNSGREMNFNKIQWRCLTCPNDAGNHEVHNKDCIELLKEQPQVDLAYIDPPYGTAQSDYTTMYKFFESYIQHDINIFTQNQKKFINISNYEDNFRELILALSYIPVLVISYNNSSWSNIDRIKEILLEVREIQDISTVNYRYKYRKKSDSIEYIIVVK